MGITRQQALDCFASDDLIGIGMEADAVRRTLHPDGVVTYTVDFPLAISDDSANLTNELRQMIRMGATGVQIPGDSAAIVTFSACEALIARIKHDVPHVGLHGLSATRILSLARSAQLPLRDALMRLRDAGLASIDSDAVILDDALRQRVAPGKCSVTEWLDVHRTAHQLGLVSSATMIFGVGETYAQSVGHLELLRTLQEETGGFTSFSPVAYQAGTLTAPSTLDEPTAVEYLKTLAVSRLYLDTIPNLQSSWANQGLKVLQMALRFGANDVGSVLLQEHFGKPGGATEEELRRIIREAGFKPAERDALYRSMSFQ